MNKHRQHQSETARRELTLGMGSGVFPHPVDLRPAYRRFDGSPARRRRRPFLLRWFQKKSPGYEPRPVDPERAVLTLKPSSDDDFAPEHLQHFVAALATTVPFSWEVHFRQDRVSVQCSVARQDAGLVTGEFYAHFPRGDAFEDVDQLTEVEYPYARCYRLAHSHLFSLPALVKKHEPYVAPLGAFTGRESTERGVLQIICVQLQDDWPHNFMAVSTSPADPGKSAFIDRPELPKMAAAKAGSPPFFAAVVKLAATSLEALQQMERAFLPQFAGGHNSLQPVEEPYPLASLPGRQTYSRGLLLNAAELAGLVHPPIPALLPNAVAIASPSAPPPKLATENILIPLGLNRYRGQQQEAGISEEWATRPTFISGGTGYGKTTSIARFADVLPLGYGLGLVDSKEDLAELLLDVVPADRVEDVVYFDAGNTGAPPALNPLVVPEGVDPEDHCLDVLATLRHLFSAWGDNLELFLYQSIRTCLLSSGVSSLRDLRRLHLDEKFRAGMVAQVADPDLKYFWEKEYPRFPAATVKPVLNKLGQLLSRPVVRNILCQPETLNFGKYMTENRIFIGSIPIGLLGEEVCVLLHKVILFGMLRAALRRPRKNRNLWPVLVDEFSLVAGQDADVRTLSLFISLARSYRTPLVAATQFTAQLHPQVLAALKGNPGTRIALRSGADDAGALAREFGGFPPEELMKLGVGQALVMMGQADQVFDVDVYNLPDVLSFKERIVARSRQGRRKRGEVETLLRSKDRTPATEDDSPQELGPEALACLNYVVDHPDKPITSVRQALGLSGYRAQQIRQQLTDAGHLILVETRLGRGGRRAKYGVPTAKGSRLMGKELPGRGGPVHRHLQQLVTTSARARGYEVQIERRLESGGYVDVHLEGNGGKSVAVEVSVYPEALRELRNIEKCLNAGYQKVLCLFLDRKVISEAEREAREKWPELIDQRVVIAGVDDLESLL